MESRNKYHGSIESVKLRLWLTAFNAATNFFISTSDSKFAFMLSIKVQKEALLSATATDFPLTLLVEVATRAFGFSAVFWKYLLSHDRSHKRIKQKYFRYLGTYLVVLPPYFVVICQSHYLVFTQFLLKCRLIHFAKNSPDRHWAKFNRILLRINSRANCCCYSPERPHMKTCWECRE
jgi:hypothetical protein